MELGGNPGEYDNNTWSRRLFEASGRSSAEVWRCAPGDVAWCTPVGTVPFRARPWVGTGERAAEKWQLPCGGEDPAGGGAEGEAAPFEGGQRLAEALGVDPESAAEVGAGARSACGA